MLELINLAHPLINLYHVERGEGNTTKAIELVSGTENSALIVPNLNIIRDHSALKKFGGEYIPTKGKILWANKNLTPVFTSISHARMAGYRFDHIVIDELDLFHVKQEHIRNLIHMSPQFTLTGHSKKWPNFNVENYIRESNAIESIYDNREISQSIQAWDYLINQPELNHVVIKEVQKLITFNQTDLDDKDKGNYRHHNVRVGMTIPPDHEFVPHLMENWLMDYGDLDPLEAHVRFEKIHPCLDGNGRTGRMLYWWHCVQNEIEPILFKAESKVEDYYPLFK